MDRIERTVHIDADPERVWATITEPELIKQWFGDGGATVELRVGGAMSLTWREHGTVRAEVTEVDRPRAFGFRWAAQTDVDPEPGNCTDVRFVLEPAGGGTALTVVETGFESVLGSDPDARRAENTEGWAQELGELVALLSPVPS